MCVITEATWAHRTGSRSDWSRRQNCDAHDLRKSPTHSKQ